MALSTSRTVVTNTGLSTHHHFRVRDLISVGVATFSNFKTGSTNVHSVGVEAAGINVLGADTPIGTGSTIYNDGGARFSGIVSATTFSGAFTGDGQNLTGLPAGLGTALSSTQTDPLNKIYYTDKVLSISTTQTIDHPATANLAYTQYGDIKIEDGHDLIIKTDDDFKYDILGISTTKLADNYFQNGLTIGFGSLVKGDVTGNVTGNVTGTASGNPTLANGSNNRVITATGANALTGETNLKWDGETLYIDRSSNTIEGLSISNSNNSQASAGAQLNLSGGDNSYSNIRLECNGTSHHIRQDGSGNLKFYNNTTQRMSIAANGDFLFLKTSADQQATGVQFEDHGLAMFTKDNIVAYFTRTGSDGQMIRFYGDTSSEGSINISGTSISYNGGVLSRWSQIVGISTNNKADRPTIYQGTVMSNLDEMCEWGDEENMQLNKTQVSTVSGDKNVAGVFWAWDDDDDTYLNDYYVAQTGDYIIRVGAATTVTRGDLLESAGDGTAKPQSDDIVRSKTVAKITSGIAHTTYSDGTKTYPCVLMAS